MADNVQITAGTGTTIRTDDIGSGVQVQYVKLMDGADGSTAVIAGDATYGIDVDITRIPNTIIAGMAALPAGTNVIGQVYGGGNVIAQTPTITAGAYTAKDAVGGKLTFANAARVNGGGGIINSVTVVDDDSELAGLELWLYNQDFTATNDNAAFDPTDADNENLIGVIPITAADYFVAADNAVACVPARGLQYKLVSTTSMYGQLKCTGTPTYTATGDLTVKIAVEYLD